jgi:hypothetical protein
LKKPVVKLCLIAAVPLIAAESYALPCPQQIGGLLGKAGTIAYCEIVIDCYARI